MIIAANFKTNHTRASTKEYISTLSQFIKSNDIKDEVYIFPTASSLDEFKTQANVTVGTQNAYGVKNGSFTGEIGLEQLEEFNIKTILIGHSERRALGDDNTLVKSKFDFFKKNNFKIIYCVGESLETREKGLDEVRKFLYNQLDSIDLNYDNLVIAYEPIWAIGTGVSATIAIIDETLNLLANKTTKPILYGGSVKVETIKETISLKNCSGVLVGSASWNIFNFCKMLHEI